MLDDVRVEADRLLDELHEGFKVAMATLDGGRIGIAAQARRHRAGRARDGARVRARAASSSASRSREFQAIQWKLADMATELDAARLLAYRAAWREAGRASFTREGAMAKLFASREARRA